MFALMPWTRRNALLPRGEGPLARIPEEFASLIDRFMNNWPVLDLPEIAEWPNRWGLTTEENDTEFILRFELPGFEPAEVNVELIGDRLTVAAEHAPPAAKNEEKTEERTERARVRRMVTLPPGIEMDKAEASFRNGVLEIHVPREPKAVGRKIEVKT